MSSSVELQSKVAISHSFALYCYANRGPETKLRHAVGLIEKHLQDRPDDMAALGCRAGLLMQSSKRNHPEMKSDLYRLLAMRTQESILNEIRIRDRSKMLFVHGTSLAQIGFDSAFDEKAMSKLKQFLKEYRAGDAPEHCRYEAMIALSLLEQENQQPEKSKTLFLTAQKKIGRPEAIVLFEDYVRLRSKLS